MNPVGRRLVQVKIEALYYQGCQLLWRQLAVVIFQVSIPQTMRLFIPWNMASRYLVTTLLPNVPLITLSKPCVPCSTIQYVSKQRPTQDSTIVPRVMLAPHVAQPLQSVIPKDNAHKPKLINQCSYSMIMNVYPLSPIKKPQLNI